MAERTRSAIAENFSGLFELLGSGSELTQSELPTLRQCLRYGLLIKERSVADVDKVVMVKSILSEVKEIWVRVNPDICMIKD